MATGDRGDCCKGRPWPATGGGAPPAATTKLAPPPVPLPPGWATRLVPPALAGGAPETEPGAPGGACAEPAAADAAAAAPAAAVAAATATAPGWCDAPAEGALESGIYDEFEVFAGKERRRF
mmetsp:Transcript_85451/g.190904  ORF Transcript_85451/g.190904 Transcript_85451/m.190904 type:complete len:122 (-) Transcript_85451:1473-1838(-)